MKRHRTQTLTMAGILAAATGLAWAQQPGAEADQGVRPSRSHTPVVEAGTGPIAGGAAATADARMERMARSLDLSPEQRVQVETMLRELEAECTAKRKEMREKMLAILTPDQRAKFERAPVSKQGRGDAGPRPKAPAAGPEPAAPAPAPLPAQ
jgi:Spy/CpxP family protein refolding chaperone